MTEAALSPLARCEAYIARQAGPPSRGAVRPLTERLRTLEPAHAALQERHSQTLCELARVQLALADAQAEAEFQSRRAEAAGYQADMAAMVVGSWEEISAAASDRADRATAERDAALAQAAAADEQLAACRAPCPCSCWWFVAAGVVVAMSAAAWTWWSRG